MTTHLKDDDENLNEEQDHQEQPNKYSWDVAPEEDKDKPPIEDAVTILMAPYVPAQTEMDADKTFTTNEIIAALEMHYGVPQGDVSYVTNDAGVRVIKKLTEMGFRYANTGDLQLQWLLKKK